MESFSNLGPYKKHPLAQVNLKFFPETFDSELQKYLKFVKKASTVQELNDSIVEAGKKILYLDAFNECHVKILPGKYVNTAEAQFHLVKKEMFKPQINMETDPLEVSLVSYFRNLFGSVNSLILKLGFELEHKNKTFMLNYLSKVGVANKFQYGFEVEKASNYLDINVHEHLHSLAAYINTYDDVHSLKLGYYLRNNEIFVNRASSELINEGLLPSSKTSLIYKYSKPYFPILNLKFSTVIQAELAFSNKLEFLKLEKSVNKLWSLTNNLKVLLNLDCGYTLPLQAEHISLNDRFRYKEFKGFKFIGRRFRANNEELAERLEVEGDHLGSRSKLSGNIQLIHTAFPLFSRLGVNPFLFVSAAYLHETDNLLKNSRAAAGFGAKVAMPFGVLEFVYTSKFWAQPGDCPAEFQIFFKEN